MSNIAHVEEQAFDAEVLRSETPVVVDFWPPWCGPCRMVAPELEALASAHDGNVKVVKVNIDDAPGLATGYGIMGVPTIALFKEGEMVAQSVGAKSRARIEAELGL